ncbi:MAG: hypothetical protein Q9164_000877 [Protoblastenia rupestris]
MPPKPKLNVQSFPRPPHLEKVPRNVLVKYQNQTIAETKDAYWALETHHPPTYYLPQTSFAIPLHKSTHSSFCEWKGRATYWNIALPGTAEIVQNKAWSYESPTKGFEPIKGFLSLYANAPWECYVDGEKVEPQEGDFYGGFESFMQHGTTPVSFDQDASQSTEINIPAKQRTRVSGIHATTP